jgi:hypothetical protein
MPRKIIKLYNQKYSIALSIEHVIGCVGHFAGFLFSLQQEEEEEEGEEGEEEVGREEEEGEKIEEKPKYDEETQLLIDGRYTCVAQTGRTEWPCLSQFVHLCSADWAHRIALFVYVSKHHNAVAFRTVLQFPDVTSVQ